MCSKKMFNVVKMRTFLKEERDVRVMELEKELY